MSSSIGIVGMSAKPLHRGHEAIINAAGAECQTVYLIVSLTARERPGEVIITHDAAEYVWFEMVRYLPDNVIPVFVGDTSAALLSSCDNETMVRNMAAKHLEIFMLNAVNKLGQRDVTQDEIESAQKLKHGPSINTPVGWTWWLMSVFCLLDRERPVRVYVGPDDADRFPVEKITKYTGKNSPVEVRVVGGNERLFGISGTQMREFIGQGKMKQFIDNLPSVLPNETKMDIWRSIVTPGVRQAPLRKIKEKKEKV